MHPYHHFTVIEREKLQSLLSEGKSKTEIAKAMGKDRSSIYRELSRNGSKDGTYQFWRATSLYVFRRKRCHRKTRLAYDTDLLAFVKHKLDLFWPPETIVAIWKRDHPGAKLSHCTIYRALKNKWIDGYTCKYHLRRRGHMRYARRSAFNAIQPEYTIHDRPIQAETRERVGDWEFDTVHGKLGKGGIITGIDRCSRFLLVGRYTRPSADEVCSAIVDMLRSLTVHSLTMDNGSEFAQFRPVQDELNTKVYFADPHSPWQRGSNENMNGLLRFFFPKGTDFNSFTDEQLMHVVDLINDRPRKCLNWLSPRDVFSALCRT